MHLIRQAKITDAPTLLKLARSVHFINLPPDRPVIETKIRRSRECFKEAREGVNGPGIPGNPGFRGGPQHSPTYMFVLEDPETGNVIGTSSIVASMGDEENPNLCLRLRKRDFFSEELQSGHSHVTAQLTLDHDGPTEIGGLILAPGYRGHKEKLGKQLSFVRFHYIGLHRKRFKDDLLAEMMGAITDDSHSTLWEYFGRRFINLSYMEADRFSAHSREFMLSLLPREELYLSLLPPEARALVGQVRPETRPARAMLEALGFHPTDRVDPFDGGPHIEAKTNDIEMIRTSESIKLGDSCTQKDARESGFVSFDGGVDGSEFRAVHATFRRNPGGKSVSVPKRVLETLGASPGQKVGITPTPEWTRSAKSAARDTKPRRKKASGGKKKKSRSQR